MIGWDDCAEWQKEFNKYDKYKQVPFETRALYFVKNWSPQAAYKNWVHLQKGA